MGRWAVVAVVVSAVLLSVAVPLKAFLEQRSELAQLTATQADLRQERGELQAQIRAWDDSAFVAAQARERLGYVRPGEVGLTVVNAPGQTMKFEGGRTSPIPERGMWWDRMAGGASNTAAQNSRIIAERAVDE